MCQSYRLHEAACSSYLFSVNHLEILFTVPKWDTTCMSNNMAFSNLDNGKVNGKTNRKKEKRKKMYLKYVADAIFMFSLRPTLEASMDSS